MRRIFIALLLLIGTTCFSQEFGKVYHSDTVLILSPIKKDTISITARKNFEIMFNSDGTALIKNGNDSTVVRNMGNGKYDILPSGNMIKVFNVMNKNGKEFVLSILLSGDERFVYMMAIGNQETVFLISVENK